MPTSRLDHKLLLSPWRHYLCRCRSTILTAMACIRSSRSTRKLPMLSYAKYGPKVHFWQIQSSPVVCHNRVHKMSHFTQTKHAMQAYRKLAKTRHPDRGGSAAQFSQLQQAFEVLSDPRQREVYDAWARQTQFRYVQGAASQVRMHIHYACS